MKILLANFDAQNHVTKPEIIEALATLPSEHIEDIQVIRYDPDRAIAVSLSHATGKSILVSSKGLFYHEQDVYVIVLFAFHSKREFYHVFFHEIGHYVFLKYLKQEQRDEWMYSVRKNEPDTVSEYAKKNSREDFAETYAYCCTFPARLSTLHMRTGFMLKHVFPHAPQNLV